MSQISVDIDRGNLQYRSQAAALHVLDAGDERGVITDIDAVTADAGKGCDTPEPGFPGEFRLYTSETDSCRLNTWEVGKVHWYLTETGKGMKLERLGVKPVG